MSIATALTALAGDIEAAKAAITAKGGTVASGDGSSQLASDIATIPSGGSETDLYAAATEPSGAQEGNFWVDFSEDIPAAVIVEPLSVNENGTYTAPSGKAYSPITVYVSSGAAPDFVVYSKTVSFPTKKTSGAQVLASASELVAAGVLDSTSKTIYSQWDNFMLMLMSDPTNFTHSTKQIVYTHRHSFPFDNNGGTIYYSVETYHNTSATTVSRVADVTTVNGTATGHMTVNSTTGITLTASSTYGLGKGDYKLVVACWGKKS